MSINNDLPFVLCDSMDYITMLVTPTAMVHWGIKLLTNLDLMYIVKLHCSVFVRCHQFVRSSASEGFRLHTRGGG